MIVIVSPVAEMVIAVEENPNICRSFVPVYDCPQISIDAIPPPLV